MEPIYVYMKKVNLYIFAITTFIFTLIGTLLTLFGLFEPEETGALITGLVFLALFGSTFIYFFKKIRKPKPALILSIEGIQDFSTTVGGRISTLGRY